MRHATRDETKTGLEISFSLKINFFFIWHPTYSEAVFALAATDPFRPVGCATLHVSSLDLRIPNNFGAKTANIAWPRFSKAPPSSLLQRRAFSFSNHVFFFFFFFPHLEGEVEQFFLGQFLNSILKIRRIFFADFWSDLEMHRLLLLFHVTQHISRLNKTTFDGTLIKSRKQKSAK